MDCRELDQWRDLLARHPGGVLEHAQCAQGHEIEQADLVALCLVSKGGKELRVRQGDNQCGEWAQPQEGEDGEAGQAI
jgi:hypothetical protein